ncbi:GSCOCG00002172001-RA-CDS [Cotesia congregata]|uniref:Cyclin-dependent kinase inhibitor domain-containing protein n=1 Tax=Cotesia congregata TaxID=51543 RepID=A0A8J2MSH7_COTCN|nr:GSCOCG00002172001-RA-CDS [Cotesia congregata]CAG5104029.1 Protein of unknown function [Cotesia congregata]
MDGDKRNKNTDKTKLQNVRRRLFTDTDDNQENNEEEKTTQGNDDNLANRLIEETRFEAKERWNFDFEKDEPLNGQWEWVKIDEEFSDRNPPALGNSHNNTRDNLQQEKIDNNNH